LDGDCDRVGDNVDEGVRDGESVPDADNVDDALVGPSILTTVTRPFTPEAVAVQATILLNSAGAT
jgi:hypothetical protein